ncbi:MAG: hypothetical protein JNM57_01750 [Cyclobacteriaceae bacterium]|nr:hypothetical protein [Cyclobacteriaceae bacterium]
MIYQNKRLAIILFSVILLLFIPWLAMQFTNEVNWSFSDFVVAGVVLAGAGLGCEWVVRKIRITKYRIAICAIILIALVLLWVELAVGIFGSPFAGN